jgi:Skp family chaperone for outer membrane proteins
MSEKLARLETKMAQLKSQLQRERNREAEDERKRETRKKIIAGAAVLKLMKDEPSLGSLIWQELDTRITAERDREVLGLPPRAQRVDLPEEQRL